MATKKKQTTESPGVQVFELTMDNTEDQDELNRRLTKPGEPNNSQSAMLGKKGNGASTTESAE